MKYIKEPVNSLTHMTAAVLAIPATIYLLWIAVTPLERIAYLVFGLSMLLLYSASAIYHALRVSPKHEKRLRKLDHSMIFVLIAGTYTPICLIPLRGPWGYGLLAVIWAFAIGGVLMKMFWINAPRWLSTAIYLIMGWLCLFAFYPIVHSMRPSALLWLVAGGIFYSIGAIIYGRKKSLLHWRLGFHEIFHIFIMIGTFCHYVTMLCIV